jgi:hypothetical protein
MDAITSVCLTIVFLYCITQILKFYGVNQSTYLVYVLFYVFILFCILILPNDEPTF